ncbi:hypothetical protein D9758_009088 [Tetrapyrgos nigripes]|uniref:MFS general substrate transporter n=1 Tax=Tetrapyrgos nigripes TaxID=182062 RepID=A0A8H5GAC1_9AGAR|nr:hypothetical protein D9758_009088 [Tetrapyrgos nigripes]
MYDFRTSDIGRLPTERGFPATLRLGCFFRGEMTLQLLQRKKTQLNEAEEKKSPAEDHNDDVDSELVLPKMASLVIVLLSNMFMQISFFIVVSSSNEYAKHLGGTSTFSGVVIGIPTVFSGLTLIPLMKYDRGGYKIPLHVCCASLLLGHIFYALAYHFSFLYLILIGRCVNGIGFSMWMYCKRYCSDPRIVGLRRRTLLASWLMTGNGVGMGIGPLLGGILYKYVGFDDPVTQNANGLKGSLWNGFTSPAWLLAGMWVLYWIAVCVWFEDVEKNALPLGSGKGDEVQGQQRSQPAKTEGSGSGSEEVYVTATAVEDSSPSRLPTPIPISRPGHRQRQSQSEENPLEAPVAPTSTANPATDRISSSRYPVIGCMCWFAMACFFILGAWEANIPVYTSPEVTPELGFSPFAAGNFLSLGALICFPFFIGNVFLARRVQDRWTLATGTFIGGSALVIFLILLGLDKTSIGGISPPHSLLTNSSTSMSTSTSTIYDSDTSPIREIGLASAPALFVCWFLVALGFNIASTVTMSLLSKQLPSTPRWNGISSLVIQYSNYTGRVTGAVWGGYGGGIGGVGRGAGVLTAERIRSGMMGYVGLELAIVCIGGVICGVCWRQLKAKTG